MIIHLNSPGTEPGSVVNSYDKGDRTTQSSCTQPGEKVNTGYALDISGKVRDNDNYRVHGRTMEEVMQNAQAQDVTVQENYMTVMSNSMSEEDFARLQKEGYSARDMEPEQFVSIVDKIKAVVAQSGKTVAGYNDDLDLETLEQITGSQVMAQALQQACRENDIPLTEENVKDIQAAWEKAQQLDKLPPQMTRYLINKEELPTVDHLYLAKYSAMGSVMEKPYGDGQNVKEAPMEGEDFYQLQTQMKEIISSAGYEVTPETLQDAQWMINEDLPLTRESFSRLQQLKEMQLPLTQEELVQDAAVAIAEGGSAADAIPGQAESVYQQAVRIQKEFDARTAIDNIKARAQLEEVRLLMTVEANVKLLKSGFSIETAPMEELIQKLRETVAQLQEEYFGTSAQTDATLKNRGQETETVNGQRAQLYEQTMTLLEGMEDMPAAVAGRFRVQSDDFTLEQVSREGAALRDQYEQAKERYETLMTAPRSDMGDSIRKAFRNVDAILEDLQLPLNEYNRKAVRILGYNSMEINRENIENVKAVEQSLQGVIRQMTPAATLQMIRDGQNPLTMNMAQLDQYLAGQQTFDQRQEKYSRFLYQLDVNHEITPEERETYLGIYRLLRQIEKDDGAAVGALVESGMELSFRNLLTELRTEKKGRVEAKIDDSFGGLEQITRKGSRIDSQIQTAFYQSLTRQILDTVTPGAMKDALAGKEQPQDVMLEQLAESIGTAQEEDIDQEYRRVQLNQLREAVADTPENRTAVDFLKEMEQPVTAANIEAAVQLLDSFDKSLQRLAKAAEQTDIEVEAFLAQQSKQTIESMGDPHTAVQAAEQFAEEAQKILEEAAETPGLQQLDIRRLSLLHKQFTLTAGLARQQYFEVPMQLENRYTTVRIQIRHGESEEQGSLDIRFSSEKYGQVQGHFRMEAQAVEGYLITDSGQSVDALQELAVRFEQTLTQQGQGHGQITVLQGKPDRTRNLSGKVQNGQTKGVSDQELYRLARTFLGQLQEA